MAVMIMQIQQSLFSDSIIVIDLNYISNTRLKVLMNSAIFRDVFDDFSVIHTTSTVDSIN